MIQNTHVEQVKPSFRALRENTVLHCHAQSIDHPDCTYEILEIKTDRTVMTLAQYNEITNKNALWSIIILSILALIMAVLAGVEYIRYNKIKNKLQSMERTPQ